MANVSTASNVVAFTRTDFPRYLKMLHAACSKGIGALAMSRSDPISEHLNDDFIKDLVSDMSRRGKKEFVDSLPTEAEIRSDPRKVFDGLSKLYKHRLFVYDTSQKFESSLIRSDYSALKSECNKWIQSEAHVYAVCCQSLENGKKLDADVDKFESKLAGRALFDYIKDLGKNFSDRAACTLAKQLTMSKMHGGDTVARVFLPTPYKHSQETEKSRFN